MAIARVFEHVPDVHRVVRASMAANRFLRHYIANMDERLRQSRAFLKDTIRKEVNWALTNQSRGIPPPPLEKPFRPEAQRIDLPRGDAFAAFANLSLLDAVRQRESVRAFAAGVLPLAQLAFLLWATQGVRGLAGPGTALRTVPSAGARHALETYLYVRAVPGLDEGIYRYLPVEHQLLFEFSEPDLRRKMVRACFGQTFVGDAGATFLWAAIPYRMEWRYDLAAHRVIALDAGHVCQNLYLACQAISAGTCAVAAYDQEMLDRLLRLDGEDEFVVYLAPVGQPAGTRAGTGT